MRGSRRKWRYGLNFLIGSVARNWRQYLRFALWSWCGQHPQTRRAAQPGADPRGRARGQIKPRVEQLAERAQAQGALREALHATDFPLIIMMLDTVVDTTREVDPDTWRRTLGIVLDGLAARRDAPTPLPSPALEVEQ